jgi:hypothetical protein
MPSKLDELRRKAEDAARQIDERFEIKSKLNEGARRATDALRKGADAATSALDAAREEVSRVDREHRVSDRVSNAARRAAESVEDAVDRSGIKKKAADAAEEAAQKAGEFAGEARDRAEDLFGEARKYYESATGAAKAGVSAARLPQSLLGAVTSARSWAKKNPGKAAVVSLAFIAGSRAGAAFSSLDVVLLGAGGAGSWLFHSAVAPYGLRKLSEKYEAHLKRQERLINEGKLSDAERDRLKFMQDAAKYVGAPLLGAFSIAAGAGLVAEAVSGGVVTGFPINLVLGGNPMLASIWLFGNGLVCFHNGYKFFMMALGDKDEVQRVVRDIKGLLPAMEN